MNFQWNEQKAIPEIIAYYSPKKKKANRSSSRASGPKECECKTGNKTNSCSWLKINQPCSASCKCINCESRADDEEDEVDDSQRPIYLRVEQDESKVEQEEKKTGVS